MSKPPIILEPINQIACRTVIWLHGLGADGHDFESIVPQLSASSRNQTRFVFPNAPIQPVTINQGACMPSWYDIVGVNLAAKIDWQGISESVKTVHQLIDIEISKGILAENIILAGFSQGGLIALHAGLSYQKSVAGIMALSTYFPIQTEQDRPVIKQTDFSQQTLRPSILIAHGHNDTVCPISGAELSRDTLSSLGFEVVFKTYPMAHQVCHQEVDDISQFIEKVSNIGAL